jgi:hypothetical protein
MGFAYFKERRSLSAAREGDRRIRRSDPPLNCWREPPSELVLEQEKLEPQKIVVEVFLSGGPLSI